MSRTCFSSHFKIQDAFRCNNWICTKPMYCMYKTQSNGFYFLRGCAIYSYCSPFIVKIAPSPIAAKSSRRVCTEIKLDTYFFRLLIFFFFIEKIIRLIIVKALSFVPRSFLQVLSLS